MSGKNVPINPVVDINTRQPYVEQENVPLDEIEFGGGGAGGGGPIDPNPSMKEYLDAKVEVVESRLEGKLDRLATKGTIWTAVATVLGIVFAAWALAGDRFDAGLSLSPVVGQIAANQNNVDTRQDAKLEMLDDKLDILLERTANANAQ